jgi:hypothetical protein
MIMPMMHRYVALAMVAVTFDKTMHLPWIIRVYYGIGLR